jgi:hypothetical protein
MKGDASRLTVVLLSTQAENLNLDLSTVLSSQENHLIRMFQFKNVEKRDFAGDIANDCCKNLFV